MQNSLSEIPIFLYCLRTGLIIGISYDVMRLLRFERGWLLRSLADVIFGAFAVIAAALTLFYCDYGRLRLYQFIAIALGAWLYQRYPGRFFRQITANIFRRKERHKKA